MGGGDAPPPALEGDGLAEDVGDDVIEAEGASDGEDDLLTVDVECDVVGEVTLYSVVGVYV